MMNDWIDLFFEFLCYNSGINSEEIRYHPLLSRNGNLFMTLLH